MAVKRYNSTTGSWEIYAGYGTSSATGTSGSAFANLSASGTASINNLIAYGTSSFVGTVVASAFSGDGSLLTNLPLSSYATIAYANSASLNAYASAISVSQAYSNSASLTAYSSAVTVATSLSTTASNSAYAAASALALSASLTAYSSAINIATTLSTTASNSAYLAASSFAITQSNSASLNAYIAASAFANSASLNAYSSAVSMISGSAFTNLSASGTASVNTLTVYGKGKVAYQTDGRTGGVIYTGSTAPVSPVDGDIWVDNTQGGYTMSDLVVTGNLYVTGTASSVGNFVNHVAINQATITSSSYTAIITDDSKLIEMNSAASNYFVVPLGSNVNFPTGTQLTILQTGAGSTYVVPQTGVTLNYTPGNKLRTQWSSGTLIKRAADTWVLIGDVSA